MSTQYPQVTIPRTKVRTLSSTNVGDEFSIFLAFPSGYDDSDETYPVIYVLDANSFFGTVTEAIRVLRIGKEADPRIQAGDLARASVSGGVVYDDHFCHMRRRVLAE